ncbi:hypothetical protein [Streptosporangium carneum]|uniref:Uncharacterized protein n=1 Tax=Streptosporangium carneum TaxID=47481 RepID=A0A9W6HUS7_9ACTN|nr:hypothetical protein [Streptosporangium carneum]GLK06722.1 hypothetical protein GCM10017600_01270 [Streptosporangium carneum]
MNEIVDRLRDAARAVGETVDDVPPFAPGAGRADGARWGARRTRRPWVVPLVAAATVAGVIAGAAVVTQGGEGGVAGPVAGVGPAYFATSEGAGIVFHRSDTGEETGRFSVPVAGGSFGPVEAARDAFYTSVGFGACETRFFRVRLSRTGEVAGADTLPITLPKGTAPTSLAVSADGAKLAYGLASCEISGPFAGRLGVTDLVTGRSRTLASPRDGEVVGVSLTADGRSVAFQRLPTTDIDRRRAPLPRVTPTDTVHVEPTPAKDGAAAPAPSVGVTAEPRPIVTVTVSPAPLPGSSKDAGGETEASPRPGTTVTATPVPVPHPKAAEPDARPSTTSAPEDRRSAEAARTPLWWETGSGSGASAELASDAPEMWVLDTEAEGEDLLDTARKIELRLSPAAPEGLHGVRISADGLRFTAALGRVASRGEGSLPEAVPGSTEIATFDAGNGEQTGVLYRDGLGGFRLVGADGSGEHLLVQRGPELGTISAGRYRVLLKVREPYVRRIAW